ncbi:anaerobic ribonucleoside-triphosphate reductase activating protein [Paraclostridium sordellii]|uniref:anaerobic ribonucleoside-triphosphate reductase activating protein n=1 Tax=Paraclostridium sordellii TaxID=1505 RepID=UPI0005E79C7F|nr:anaerobic ribonucleoside-triphosphate reductase activating protein [Paeniclostridium sordellii]RGX06775.1 anaerobic ribonucleoside-triphosphate reductase activating protein [Paeniclostridium sordellii]CEN21429.1 anaerobic ribonucleoside-triphosphate reductase activating protein [[Clostridium] sordellii] [Paeniclostridium sordellii]
MKFSKIKDNDIANGLGITMSFWTQGCPHHCNGCFNKETWDFEGGKEFTQDDLDYIIENINKNNIKRDLSVLGGEPLCPQNIEGVIYLCKEFKRNYPEKLIYLWTGYTIETFNETQKEILNYIDILVDGKFEEDRKNLSIKLRGSSNQRVIDVKQYLESDSVILYKLS